MPQEITLEQLLIARDRRAARQRALLEKHRLPLLSFTMNIAGPEKNSPLIRRGFLLGRRLLLEEIARAGGRIAEGEDRDEITGCEGLYAVELPAAALKEIAVAVEDASPLGRLFDMDVLTGEGERLGRGQERPCLVCGRGAKACARSRAHPLEEVRAATRSLLTRALDDEDAKTAAALAQRALLYEVCVTPKPGLVDRLGSGSHRDMDIYLFMDSASVLWPFFSACLRAGRNTAHLPAPDTLAALRPLGRRAEGDMRLATGGVNTHKGAIYALGLVCGALGRLDRAQWKDAGRVLNEAGAMAAGSVARELNALAPDAARTAGQRAYLLHGISGIRGEAEAGFPTVLSHGLPALENALARGADNDEAGCIALLALMAHAPDTNLIARGGIEGLRAASQRAQSLLDKKTIPSRRDLEEMDALFVRENLSPGGSADLLSLCWMTRFLRVIPDETPFQSP